MTKRTPEEAIWAETQATLRPQMTKATYEAIIEGTVLLSSANEVYKICTPTTMSKEWLENRLKSMVVRALVSVMGQPIVGVEFEVANKSVATVCQEIDPLVPSPGNVFKTLPSETQPDESAITASACATFARAVDFPSLWFEKGRSAGYTRVPDYAFQFWMLYLNNIKPKTFDLWFRIISDDKRNVNEPHFTYWTPVKQYSLKALGRAVGTLSTITVTGGPRSCWFNEQAKKLTGHPLLECCSKYQPVKWHQTEHGTVCCQHWQTGLLEVLYQEGLIAIEIIKPPPASHGHTKRGCRLGRIFPSSRPIRLASSVKLINSAMRNGSSDMDTCKELI